MTNTPMHDQIALDAITALIISNELDATELLSDIRYAPIDEIAQTAAALNDSLKTPLCDDHAERLIRSIHDDDALLTQIAQSLEICPMHLCDDQICADDEIAECAHLR